MSDYVDARLKAALAGIGEAMSLIARLRGENEYLRAELALLRGTLAKPDPEIPAQITHDVPPDAPR